MSLFDNINVSKYRVADFMELVIGAVTFVAAVVAVLTFLQGQSPTVVIVAFVAVFGLCLIFFIKVRKLADMNLERLNTLADTFKMCTEAIKEGSHVLQQAHLRGDLTDQVLGLHVKNTCQDFVDRIANALSTSADEKINVCVKVFSDHHPRAPVVEERSDDYLLKTLCRSRNTSSKRFSSALSRVGDNTDFLTIINLRWPFFRHRDLVAYDKQLRADGAVPYRNSNLEWRDHYRGIIVVPIAEEQRILSSGVEIEANLLGFLCADSLSSSAFPISHIGAYTDLLLAFAAALYPYFDRMYSFLQELDERKGAGNDVEPT